MIVAFFHPHNEGVVAGIITGPGFDSDTELVDTYEVDAQIRSFETEQDAKAWLTAQFGASPLNLKPVPGGLIAKSDY